jgi:hypothetical protein
VSWGGLNPALTAWRNAVMLRFPDKDTASDGARADSVHGQSSQHQQDSDGTVDAYDCDVDWRPAGITPTPANLADITHAVLLDFEHDPHGRSLLWIHRREIANATIDDWRRRPYDGDNPHVQHAHFESRQSRERDGREWPMPRTDRVLAELRGELPMDQTEFNRLMTGWATSTAGRAAIHQAMKSIVEEDPATGEETYRWGGYLRMANQRRDEQTEKIIEAVTAATDQVIEAYRAPDAAPGS